MKKTIFTVTAIGILGVLACSNKKDPEPAPKSRTELLTAHYWKYVSQTDSMGKDIPFKECELDDTIKFLKTNYFEVADGPKVCTGGEVSPRENKWELQDNDTKIWLYRPNVYRTIVSLDETTLVIKDEDEKIVGKLSKF